MGQRALALLLFRRGVKFAAIEVGIEKMYVAAGILVRHPAPVAGGGNRAAGVAVIGAIGGEHFIAPGIEPRHTDGVLVGIGAGVGEEHFAKAFRRQLDNPLRRFAAGEVGGGGRDGHQLFQLGFHRRQHARMLIANVDVDQLAAEIQVSIAFVIPQLAAFCPGDHQRM